MSRLLICCDECQSIDRSSKISCVGRCRLVDARTDRVTKTVTREIEGCDLVVMRSSERGGEYSEVSAVSLGSG